MVGAQLKIRALIVLTIFVVSCAPRQATELPNHLLGLSVGMAKAAAEDRLKTIAVFERDERGRQQVWRLKDDPNFDDLAIGYSEEGKLRYVTMFAGNAKKPIRFTDVGDTSKARSEIGDPNNYRYIWDVSPADSGPAYQVILYGDQKDHLSIYTLVAKGSTETEDND